MSVGDALSMSVVIAKTCAILAVVVFVTASVASADSATGTGNGMPSGEYCVVGEGSSPTALMVLNATDSRCINAIANATYGRTLLSTGWDTLDIRGNSSHNATEIARAIGFIEGTLTADRCVDWYYNVASPNGSMAVSPAGLAYLAENMNAMAHMMTTQPVDTDPFWKNVQLSWLQVQGIIAGAVQASGGALNATQAYALSAMGDLGDILNFADTERQAFDPTKLEPRKFIEWFVKSSHCSALVKLTPNMENLFFGHATWANYNMMSRIFKSIQFNFPLGTLGVVANTVTYSSWPGALTSIDDFYFTDSGLGVMETSLSIFNFSVYSACKPTQLLSFVRSSVANRMATNGSHWADLFGRLNSGTYNNQWLVVDLKRFFPGDDLHSGLLTIVEQLPGIIRSGDMTQILAFGYYPSYNIPYFKEIFDLAGYPQAIQTQGPQMLDYETCVRARLFAAYQNTVVDAPTMQHMLQYNQYTTDPLELDNSVFAIAARGDLQSTPGFFGALDAKYTSYADLRANNTIYAFAGPTPQQGVFAWSNFPALSSLTNHRSMPEQWNFTTQNFHPPT